MRVRLLKPWMNREAGRHVSVPERVARDLIRRGTAIFDDPELLGKSTTQPDKDKAIKRAPAKK